MICRKQAAYSACLLLFKFALAEYTNISRFKIQFIEIFLCALAYIMKTKMLSLPANSSVTDEKDSVVLQCCSV